MLLLDSSLLLMDAAIRVVRRKATVECARVVLVQANAALSTESRVITTQIDASKGALRHVVVMVNEVVVKAINHNNTISPHLSAAPIFAIC